MDVEGLAGDEVADADGGAAEHGWVALGEVGAQFFEELECGGVGGRVGVGAFRAAGCDAGGFVGVVFEVVGVKFWDGGLDGGEWCGDDGGWLTDPFVPLHISDAHGDVVLSVAERTVREGLAGVDVPVGERCSFGTLEVGGNPYCCMLSDRTLSWLS